MSLPFAALAALFFCGFAQPAAAIPLVAEFPDGNGPAGIINGPDSRLWFADYNRGGGSSLARSSSACDYEPLTIPVDSGPFGLVSGPDGNVWVTLRTTDALERLTTSYNGDPTHSLETMFNIWPGNGPTSITVGDDAKLWWTDSLSNDIGRMNPDGSQLAIVPLQFGDDPYQIAAGPDGRIWFTDWGTNSIGVLSVSATYTSDVTEYKLPNGGTQPAGIAPGPDGRLWFTEESGNRIGSISTAGAFGPDISLPAPNSDASSIVAGPDGNMWFVESNSDRVGWLSPTTNSLLGEASFKATPVPHVSSPPPVGTASDDGITVGPDGNIWFTEAAAGLIGVVGTSPFNAPCGLVPPDLTIPNQPTPLQPPTAASTTPPATAVLPTPPASPAAAAAAAAAARKSTPCKSLRKFPIHIQHVKLFHLVSAKVYVNGKLKANVRRKVAAAIDLRNLPKGTQVIKIVARTASGRTLTGKRVYHLCHKKLPSHKYLYL